MFDFDFRDIVDAAKDVVIVTKSFPIEPPGPEIVYVNHAFTELTGFTAEQAIGNNPRILQSRDTDRKTTRAIRKAMEQQVPIRTAIKNISRDGRGYWLDMSILPLRNRIGELAYFVAIEREITQQKELEQKLARLAHTDALTGLFNRRALDLHLQQLFKDGQAVHSASCILMLDIDHFKSINDQYGHHVGDLVLIQMAKVSQKLLGNEAFIARTGGEEFCVILSGHPLAEVGEIAESLRKALASINVTFEEHTISFTVSIGVAVLGSDELPDEVMIRADLALYQAKSSGRNRVVFAAE